MIVRLPHSTDTPHLYAPYLKTKIKQHGKVAVFPFWGEEEYREFAPNLYVVCTNHRGLRTPSGWPKWLLDAWITVQNGLNIVVDDRHGTEELEIARALWPDTHVVAFSETVCEHEAQKAGN